MQANILFSVGTPVSLQIGVQEINCFNSTNFKIPSVDAPTDCHDSFSMTQMLTWASIATR